LNEWFWTLAKGGVVVDVPRLDPPSFRVDVEGIQKAVAEHKPKILFLTSPNNPDGSMMSDEDLDVLLQLPVLVVLDEVGLYRSNPVYLRRYP
jgi:histidinol-phosphate aminotransferase